MTGMRLASFIESTDSIPISFLIHIFALQFFMTNY
jgi:hypothetical protein